MTAALKLVEGTKRDRDQFISRTEVLDKVKELVMLPDGEHLTVNQSADFFDVERATIDQIIYRHKDEFESDGFKILKGEELKSYKVAFLHNVNKLKFTPRLALLPKRAVLRIGMLLTCSKVAEKVRDYLLAIEDSSNDEQKHNALKYNGEWTNEIENYVVGRINQIKDQGKTAVDAFNIVSEETNTPVSTLRNRWYGAGSWEPLKDKIVHINKDTSEKDSNSNNFNNEILDIMKQMFDSNQQTMQGLKDEFRQQQNNLNNQIKNLVSDNTQLHTGIGKLWRQIESMKEEQKEVLSHVESINIGMSKLTKNIEIKNNEEYNSLEKRFKLLRSKLKKTEEEYDNTLKQIGRSALLSDKYVETESVEKTSFKMDRNGNLNRM